MPPLNRTEVLRLDAACLTNADALRRIAVAVADMQQNGPLLVLIPALAGVASQLAEVADAHVQQTGQAEPLLEVIRQQHFAWHEELTNGQDLAGLAILNDAFVEAEWMLEEPTDHPDGYLHDQIVAVGEILASHLLTTAFSRQGIPAGWMDARDVVLTDNNYNEANLLVQYTCSRMQQLTGAQLIAREILVTQAGIGSTTENFSTVLSHMPEKIAQLWANCLDANQLTFWVCDEAAARTHEHALAQLNVSPDVLMHVRLISP